MKHSIMTLIKQLIFATLLINALTPTISTCAAAENRKLAQNKQPTAQQLAQANIDLYNALHAGDLPLARQALQAGANPNMPPNSTLYFKTKHWLLYNKYMPEEPLKYPHFFTDILPVIAVSYLSLFLITHRICKPFSDKLTNAMLRYIAPRLFHLSLLTLSLKAILDYHSNRYDRIKADCAQKHQHMMAFGTPPLIYHDNADAIKMLLDHKADVNIQNIHGKTALTLAAEEYHSLLRSNGILALAPRQNQLTKKMKLLALAGAHLNQLSPQNTSHDMNADIEMTQRIREKILTELQKPKALLQDNDWFTPSLPPALKKIIAGYMLPTHHGNGNSTRNGGENDDSDSNRNRNADDYGDRNGDSYAGARAGDIDEEKAHSRIECLMQNDEDIPWLITYLIKNDELLAPLLTFSSSN